MTETKNPPLSHDEAQALLPWSVNGRLTSTDAVRFDAHLETCPECREDVEIERRIRAAVRQGSRIEYAPQPGFQNLWSRIEASDRGTSSPSLEEHAAPRTDHRAAPVAHWRLAAAALIGLAVGILAGGIRDTDTASLPAPYSTASSPGSPRDVTAQIRVVFSPAMTVDELTQVVREARLAIVSGPTEAGVYGLASTHDTEDAVTAALGRLRADPRVRFAEPVADSVAP
jgi:hypothetical protein